MKWSLKLGRFLGIDVYLHLTFLILLGVIGTTYWISSSSPAAAVEATALFASVFFCVLLHEFGHALAARRYGIVTHDITLLPIGGVARLEKMPEKPIQEIIVALAGPAVNVGIAALLGGWLLVTQSFVPVESLAIARGSFLERLLLINIGLVAFNMIPAFPMDGGRVLRGVLALLMDHAKATRIAALIGQGMAVIFAIGAFFGSPMLLLIAFFVWMGAQAEVGASEIKSVLGGVRVDQAMLTEFHTLTVHDSLRDAADLVIKGAQQDFPVQEDGRVVGVLSRTALVRSLAAHGLDGRVVEAMERDVPHAEAHEFLEVVLPRLRDSRSPVAPVFASGALVGLLNMENIAELMMIRSALSHRKVAP